MLSDRADVVLRFRSWGPYNNPEVNERKAELPLAFWFLRRHAFDVLEVGEVTPFYSDPVHPVFDSLPEKIETFKVDAAYLDFRGRNVLSISTVEHVGSGDYGLAIQPHKAIELLMKIVNQATNWLLTFAVGSNRELENDLLERAVDFLLIERTSDNNWKQVEHKDLNLYRYGDPLPHGNAVILVTNHINCRFTFLGHE